MDDGFGTRPQEEKVKNEDTHCRKKTTLEPAELIRELLPIEWFYKVVGMYFFLLQLFITRWKWFTFALLLQRDGYFL